MAGRSSRRRAFAQNNAEDFPDVLFRLEIFLAIALLKNAAHQPPADQLAQIAVGIAAADVQLFHDLIRARRVRRRHEQGVNLRHGAIDSPGRADAAPLRDKFIPRLRQGLLVGCPDSFFIYFQDILKVPNTQEF